MRIRSEDLEIEVNRFVRKRRDVNLDPSFSDKTMSLILAETARSRSPFLYYVAVASIAIMMVMGVFLGRQYGQIFSQEELLYVNDYTLESIDYMQFEEIDE